MPAWRDPRASVSVHMGTFGWRVEVWQNDKLLYCDWWDKKPTLSERRWLIRKYGKEVPK